MSFRFADARPRRRPSLTPMIDVVFLLLVFFMLAARFGQEGALDLSLAGGGASTWDGPPRLVQVGEDGLRLNGVAQGDEGLIQALTNLVETDADLILLQPAEGVALQNLLDAMALLEGAGFTNLALVAP
jgi:biopolymer transport protein ExbD